MESEKLIAAGVKDAILHPKIREMKKETWGLCENLSLPMTAKFRFICFFLQHSHGEGERAELIAGARAVTRILKQWRPQNQRERYDERDTLTIIIIIIASFSVNLIENN